MDENLDFLDFLITARETGIRLADTPVLCFFISCTECPGRVAKGSVNVI
jgi:hypothetical protein